MSLKSQSTLTPVPPSNTALNADLILWRSNSDLPPMPGTPEPSWPSSVTPIFRSTTPQPATTLHPTAALQPWEPPLPPPPHRYPTTYTGYPDWNENGPSCASIVLTRTENICIRYTSDQPSNRPAFLSVWLCSFLVENCCLNRTLMVQCVTVTSVYTNNKLWKKLCIYHLDSWCHFSISSYFCICVMYVLIILFKIYAHTHMHTHTHTHIHIISNTWCISLFDCDIC